MSLKFQLFFPLFMKATSKCDSNYPCYQSGSTQACGPYQISIPYWLAAGKPGYTGGSSDFITCVTNDDCAKKTVAAFLRYEIIMRDSCNDSHVMFRKMVNDISSEIESLMVFYFKP